MFAIKREEAKALNPGDPIQSGYWHFEVVEVLEVPEKGRHIKIKVKNNGGTMDRWCYLGSLTKRSS